MKIATWILTFNRQTVLNRLIKNLNSNGIQPNVFSNHPQCFIENGNVVDRVVINTLNNEKSNSWCARSWNSIFIKAFVEDEVDAIICIQDDTDIRPTFRNVFLQEASKFDFISGPAGDQFFYITRDVVRSVGWWDERYIGCYCGDADYFKRVYLEHGNRARISQKDSHNWGWSHNPSPLIDCIDTEYVTKTCQPNYENQHWALDKLANVNKTLLHSQDHYRKKWGADLDCGLPANVTGTTHQIAEIDWYPAFSSQLGFR